MRYRHGDNDLVRAARQQDFLRQVRTAKGIAELMSGGTARATSRSSRASSRRYFDSRQGPATDEGGSSGSPRPCSSPRSNPVREVRFRVVRRAGQHQPRRRAEQLEETVSEFLDAKASATPREPRSRPTATSPRSKEREAQEEQAVVDPRPRGDRAPRARTQAIVAARKVDFPFFFPTLRTTRRRLPGPGAAHVQDQRRAGKGKHDAYRLVLAKGVVGEYYGVQGMTWRAPPILDDPHETIVRDGRKLMVYRDGKRIRLVAWRTPKAVYWVSNTLTQSLSNQQMIGIAASLASSARRLVPSPAAR